MSSQFFSTRRRWLAVALAALGFFLGGCPDQGVECGEGLTACGRGCVDLSAQSDNCGACGVACGQAQVCVEGSCACREGSTACAGVCVVTSSDARNCGGCGQACGANEVCEAGACKLQCALGLTQCGSSCVDLRSDVAHCGACDVACADARSCREGVCRHDVVAACLNSGQVVGLQAGETTDTKGPNAPAGSAPQTVARMQDVLLTLSATSALGQARLFDYGALPESDTVGGAPNQLLVSDPYVYVINSTDNTLLTFRRTATAGALAGGTRFPNGLGLEPVEGGSVNFGPNTNPFAMVKVGNELFVTLYGNLFGDVSAGGKVARVSLTDPAKPAVVATLQLPTGAELQPFPGSSTIPGPAGITALNGRVYVTLNNLDPSTYSPGGPGLLAKINPGAFGTVERLIHLGEGCLNPGWAAPVGSQLVVSCAGKATYDANFNVVAVEKSGLVLVGAEDAVLATAPLACPAGATDCALPSAGRFAVVGNRVYLGDNNAGRLFVYTVAGNQLVERRGLAQGTSILACPVAGGPSLVGDVVALE